MRSQELKKAGNSNRARRGLHLHGFSKGEESSRVIRCPRHYEKNHLSSFRVIAAAWLSLTRG
jgi:hypothetical protein